ARDFCGCERGLPADPAPQRARPVSVLAVIPARLGATRLPRKPLRLLDGLPLVVRVWQRVVELDVADTVVVATDSDEVARVAIQQGIPLAMTRPEHSCGPSPRPE